MVTRIPVVFALPLALAVAAAGCSSSTEGVAVAVQAPQGITAGSLAPDVPFRSPGGKLDSLNRSRLPITIVAFVSPEGPDCGRVAPELIEIQNRFPHLPVSIVQISEPTEECPQGPGGVPVTGGGKGDILAIGDPQRAAWKAYLEPKANTVFLLDKNGGVVQVAALDNMGSLVDNAVRLGQVLSDVHHGGWSYQY